MKGKRRKYIPASQFKGLSATGLERRTWIAKQTLYKIIYKNEAKLLDSIQVSILILKYQDILLQ